MEKFKPKIINGECIEVMKGLDDNSIDTIITDPPYGLEFMGKKWDKFTDNEALQKWTKDWSKEAYRVAKPGAIMLCFGGTRTFHRIACGIEDAGWEIQDTLMYVYGSGFPKSHNIGKAIDKKLGNKRDKIGKQKLTGTARNKETRGAKTSSALDHEYSKDRLEIDITKGNSKWEGYGTALKPAYEPIIMAMKPRDGTYAGNALKHDVAGLNIDGARVGNEEIKYHPTNLKEAHSNKFGTGAYMPKDKSKEPIRHKGRFPANLIHDGSKEVEECFPNNTSRYFKRIKYCAKASKKERNKGLEEFPDVDADDIDKKRGRATAHNICPKHHITNCDCGWKAPPRKNHHPTIKPLALMEYLVKLTKMPNEEQIYLDPFIGSGTTAMAVKKLNRNYIGIEQNEKYIKIAEARIKATNKELF